jgi:catechol 2,3-dioxygenase-like lactoylglutathione lyase family enzyme
MKIKLTSVYVDDQEKALRFYADVLGFTKKAQQRAVSLADRGFT